ncbi:nucleoside recognition domain-containing protein [Brumimicrobium mesophilum]|uniref:nucleoside recognition domain-containing protein n=1 Tax=Brumimicrobium mesophilum TaxID=392717 RepID=UPI000D142341|nr:nucleoside recognition domain-containing protein [Brumimicrobium mesophilum]
MLLNRLWIGLFFSALAVGLGKLLFLGDLMIFKEMVDALFESAELSFKIALFLTGALCLWMGIMEIGEKGGAINILTRFVSPLFGKLFPDVPKDHPAVGSMMMNFSANMLGLDNAATPLGLKAMGQLQELNPKKDTASNAQIMFLVMNTSGLTIIPVSILAYRSGAGSASPSEVFLPILISTFFASLIGLMVVAYKQKINLLNKTILAYLGTLTVLIVSLLIWLYKNPDLVEPVSNVGGNLLLFSVIIIFLILGIRRKINVYEVFIDGAKGGFDVAIKIVPYLVAILVAIGVFKASGAMDMLFEGIRFLLNLAAITNTEFIEALPTAFMKPFSGGAARGMMLETFSTHGVDSFVGKMAATFQGSTETTFYVLAVYFGSVGINKTRYAAGAGLIADAAGIIAAIFISFLFYN